MKKHPSHPSLKDYEPNEPVPEGYKLDRLISTNGMSEFAIEVLVPVKEIAKKKAA